MKRRLFVLGGFALLAGCGGGSRPYSAGLAGGPGATPSPTPSPTPGAVTTTDFAISYRFSANRWPGDIRYIVTVTGKPGFTTPVTVNKVAIIPSVAGTEREFSLPPIPDNLEGSLVQAVPLFVTGTTPDGKSVKAQPSFLNTPTPGIAVRERNDGLTIYRTQTFDLTFSSGYNWEGALTLSLDRNPPEIVGKTTLPLPEGATLDGIPGAVTITKNDAGATLQKFPITLTLPDGAAEGKLYRFRIRATDPGSGKSVSATVVKQYGAIPYLSAAATYKSVETAGGATRYLYDLEFTPFAGYSRKVTNLRVSPGPLLGFPADTTFKLSSSAVDFTAGNAFVQTLSLTIEVRSAIPATVRPTIQIDGDVDDGSPLSQIVFINLPT